LSIWALVMNVFKKVLPGNTKKVETSLIEEFYYPKRGPGQLWEKALSEAQSKGAEVHFGAKVTKIEMENNRIIKVWCEDGNGYAADEVISSMPLNELIASLQAGEADKRIVTPEILRIADGLPYRDFVTVGLLVDRLAITNKTGIKTMGNIVPDCWIYVQDTGVKLGRIQIFNNWSPYMLADPEHSVWIGLEYFCKEKDEFWNLSEEECVRLAVKELQKIGVIDQNTKVMESCRERVRKAYPAYFDTYDELDQLTAFLNGIDNLYCIGRNGQHRYNNMDHSMATAFVAVDVLDGKAKKEELWKVNTEQIYHEEKK
ncbi:MAG: FAD-dependent oxidoreductase, partial [Lachnospiraceae bacterium]|nr:FAD-dependent oxidoreductase [Lachnospiraceae bacterium]